MIRRLIRLGIFSTLHRSSSRMFSYCHTSYQKNSFENKYEALRMQIENLKLVLECSDEEAVRIVEQNKKIFTQPLFKVNKKIVELSSKNISVNAFLLCPWVYDVPEEKLDELIKDIQRLDPKNVNDLFPLASVRKENFDKLIEVFQEDKKVIAEGNRIYYFSNRLGIEPIEVSHHFASHLLIFTTSWNNIKKSLDIMLEFDVSPQNILNCLSAFQYSPFNVRERLQMAKDAGRKDLRLWLVACGESYLNKTLANRKDIAEYLSKRFGYDIEMTKEIMKNCKSVENCRAPKVKAVLDYLMIEEKLEPHEIASNIDVLMASLKTIRSRIELLKKHGLWHKNLFLLRTSKQRFNKYIEIRLKEKRVLIHQPELHLESHDKLPLTSKE